MQLMEHIYSEEIQQFIAANDITRQAGIILFDAVVILEIDSRVHSCHSQVQVINLDKVTAIYIFEFFKPVYDAQEMYSTEEYHFSCREKELEIIPKLPGLNLSIRLRSITNNHIPLIS